MVAYSPDRRNCQMCRGRGVERWRAQALEPDSLGLAAEFSARAGKVTELRDGDKLWGTEHWGSCWAYDRDPAGGCEGSLLIPAGSSFTFGCRDGFYTSCFQTCAGQTKHTCQPAVALDRVRRGKTWCSVQTNGTLSVCRGNSPSPRKSVKTCQAGFAVKLFSFFEDVRRFNFYFVLYLKMEEEEKDKIIFNSMLHKLN